MKAASVTGNNDCGRAWRRSDIDCCSVRLGNDELPTTIADNTDSLDSVVANQRQTLVQELEQHETVSRAISCKSLAK